MMMGPVDVVGGAGAEAEGAMEDGRGTIEAAQTVACVMIGLCLY